MEPNSPDITAEDQALIRNKIFSAWWEQKFFKWYRAFFSIKEIEKEVTLQWVFGALLLSYFITFHGWVGSSAITVESYLNNSHSCWSYFQSCGEYYFLSTLPYGYTQPLLYVFFFGVMTLIIFLMSKKDWVLAHMLLFLLFLWKFFVIFFFTAKLSGNYDYYDIAFSIVFLFFPYKLFFLRLVFVFLYFLAATIKFHETWVLGTYFTALQTGLPLFPNNASPLISNLVIFEQVIGTWFLLSKNKLWQRIALFYFLCFHLYSGILVYYRYLTTAIPMLLILFGPMYSSLAVPLNKKSIYGWTFIVFLFIWQMIPFTIYGDQKVSLEGNRFGLYMFEANHQCISKRTYLLSDGSIITGAAESAIARNRCDPYKTWFNIKQACTRFKNISRVEWTFDHSINGNPFYRIVDTKDACALNYTTFRHNDWIKLPEDSPELIGYPVKNIYQ